VNRLDRGNTIDLYHWPTIEQDMKKKGLLHLALTIIVVVIAYFWLFA